MDVLPCASSVVVNLVRMSDHDHVRNSASSTSAADAIVWKPIMYLGSKTWSTACKSFAFWQQGFPKVFHGTVMLCYPTSFLGKRLAAIVRFIGLSAGHSC